MQRILALATAALLGVGSASAVDDESAIAVDKLPKSVVASLKKRFPKGELKTASKSVDKDKTTYEVTVKEGSLKADVDVDASGVITGIEKQLAEADMPKAIARAWKQKYPKGTFKTCEEVISVKGGKEALNYYEVVVETPDKKSVELEIGKDGKIRQ
ncbi:MAG TPA: PepSY-like domain-containing protein [Fimbriiglobus sp.]|jgi:hypothetical protein